MEAVSDLNLLKLKQQMGNNDIIIYNGFVSLPTQVFKLCARDMPIRLKLFLKKKKMLKIRLQFSFCTCIYIYIYIYVGGGVKDQ